jgi:hypothetical protein
MYATTPAKSAKRTTTTVDSKRAPHLLGSIGAVISSVFAFQVETAHPRMPSPACGFALANKGTTPGPFRVVRPSLITSTAVCTALAPNRFKDFLPD